MYRVAIVLLCIFAVFKQSESIKCYECTSVIDPFCADEFRNHSLSILLDCNLRMIYDLTPIHECRKIKYKVNGQTQYLRGCNIKDNGQLKDAETYLCDKDGCNSGENHRPAVFFTFVPAIVLILGVLRI